MSGPQDPSPRRRSAFAAAFLSLLFPGLGHAYAGVYTRAIGFAAAPILLISLGAGVFLRIDRLELVGLALQNLGPIQLLNIVILAYRAAAAIDAYRVTAFLNASETTTARRFGPGRAIFTPVSVAGLLAVIVVMSGVHVAVAYYDMQAQDLINCVFDPSGEATCDDNSPTASPSDSFNPGDSPSATGPADTPPPGATAAPTGTPVAGWNGTDRLNILLIGADQRPHQGTFNTDTLIVVSIDPTSHQVAMFSLPRDTVGVPLPPGPARLTYGGTYQSKINSLWTTAQHRPDLFPGNNAQRGFRALKETLGYLYGLQIQYYAEVNFDGFRKIVDEMGGVTINVQIPVLDDYYPADNGTQIRVYIPAGIQHMTGAEALIYARSRHASIDYDRAQRQQRVLLSLKDQTNVPALIPKIPELVDAFKSTVHTDIPVSKLSALLGLAGSVDSSAVRSYVFAPPAYGQPVVTSVGDSNTIYVNLIRQTVADAFDGNATTAATREKLATEGASIWVLNGSGQLGQASSVAGFLEFQGLDASAPNQRAPSTGSKTKIVVYNGAQEDAPATVAFLQKLFGVQPTFVNDPTARVDIVITTARSTPDLTPPPAP
jgi:LCP family protein required for cell wall assembly